MHEDEDFMNGLLLHLQEIGKYVSAMDIVHYLDKPKVKTVETEYCEMLFRLETERSDKELYRIIAQLRPV